MLKVNNKAAIIVVTLILLILTIGISYQYFLRSILLSPVSTVSIDISPTPTIIEALATWQDQSEFSFKYPQSLKLNPHDEDKENYSHVELTSATFSGNLIVWTQDTKASDNEDWIKREKIQGAIDTTLASLPAKKFLSGNEPKVLTTIVIKNGYLYKIEAKLDSEYWNKIYDTVTSTFAFTTGSNQTKVEAIPPQEQAPVSEESIEVFDEVVE